MKGDAADSRSTGCICNYQLCHYKFWQCTNPRALTTSASPAAPKVKRPSALRTLTSRVFLYIRAANSACKDQRSTQKKLSLKQFFPHNQIET